MRVTRFDTSAIEQLGEDPGVVAQLGEHAEGILGRAQRKAPSWLEAQWLVRAGVSDRGGFAQAIARGSGAVHAEYGGSNGPGRAYLRSSI